jgi:predicted nucleic acid-binding protein
MMRVLLDTNVVLDSMLQRPPWNRDADAILRAAAQGKFICAVTPLALATVFYVGRRVVGLEKALVGVRNYIQAFDILPVHRQTLCDADCRPHRCNRTAVVIAALTVAIAPPLDRCLIRR